MTDTKEAKNGSNRILDFMIKTGPPLVGIVVLAIQINTRFTRLEGEVEYLRRDHEKHSARPAHDTAYDRLQQNEEAVRTLKALVQSLREDVDKHLGLGHNGVPHPHGVILGVQDLERRVSALEKK